MWHLGVPKICHFYWGGGKMVYLRFLSISTFMKHNPDWKIFFWYPKNSFKGTSWGIEPGYKPFNPTLSTDYFPEVLKLPIYKNEIDFKDLQFSENIAEVHHKQVITYLKLSGLQLGLLVNFNTSNITNSIYRKANGL